MSNDDKDVNMEDMINKCIKYSMDKELNDLLDNKLSLPEIIKLARNLEKPHYVRTPDWEYTPSN